MGECLEGIWALSPIFTEWGWGREDQMCGLKKYLFLVHSVKEKSAKEVFTYYDNVTRT